MLILFLGSPFKKSRYKMTTKLQIIIVFLVLNVSLLNTNALAQSELGSIFSGTDLSGWLVPENNIWFKADNGLLKLKSGPEQTGAILWTEAEYENFILEFDFKMGEGTVDSGVFIRADHEQIQIGISGSLKRDMTASPYISGKGYPVEADGVADLLSLDEWNAMTIVAKGNNYAVWLNGEFVMIYKSETAVERGPVGIQMHGNRDMAIDYRAIKLAHLD